MRRLGSGNQFSECGQIQSSKCQPTLMHIALSHLPENVQAPESHSLQRLTWQQPLNIVMSIVHCLHLFSSWVWPAHMFHVTCTWERVSGGAWARWGWGGTVGLCVPPVVGRSGGRCPGHWWHWPPAPSQFPGQHRYRRSSTMVQWIIFSR